MRHARIWIFIVPVNNAACIVCSYRPHPVIADDAIKNVAVAGNYIARARIGIVAFCDACEPVWARKLVFIDACYNIPYEVSPS